MDREQVWQNVIETVRATQHRLWLNGVRPSDFPDQLINYHAGVEVRVRHNGTVRADASGTNTAIAGLIEYTACRWRSNCDETTSVERDAEHGLIDEDGAITERGDRALDALVGQLDRNGFDEWCVRLNAARKYVWPPGLIPSEFAS